MSNPFARPMSGAYKNLLVEGFKKLGNTELAEAVNNGNIRLAVVSSMTGNVTTLPKLTKPCIEALNALEPTQTTGYYNWGLVHGDFIPASPDGAFVYDEKDKSAVDYVKQRLSEESKEMIYFKS